MSEPGSGGYSADRRRLDAWAYSALALIAALIVGMVIKHEVNLAVIMNSQSEMRDDVKDIKRYIMPASIRSNPGG